MDENNKTKHCPECESEKIAIRYCGEGLSKEEKEEVMCYDCGKSFKLNETIIRTWKLIDSSIITEKGL